MSSPRDPDSMVLTDQPGIFVHPVGEARYTIVSYFTDDYCGHANQLLTSYLYAGIREQGGSLAIVRMPESGSWQTNCNRKGRFILDALEQFNTPIVWLDADAVIAQNPSAFSAHAASQSTDSPVDFAALIRDTPDHPWNKIQSGTLYFGNTDNARTLLREWIYRAKMNPRTWDQVNLANAWRRVRELGLNGKFQRPLHTEVLDERYVAIVRMSYHAGRDTGPPTNFRDPIIVHNQASRNLKPLKDSGDQPPIEERPRPQPA